MLFWLYHVTKAIISRHTCFSSKVSFFSFRMVFTYVSNSSVKMVRGRICLFISGRTASYFSITKDVRLEVVVKRRRTILGFTIDRFRMQGMGLAIRSIYDRPFNRLHVRPVGTVNAVEGYFNLLSRSIRSLFWRFFPSGLCAFGGSRQFTSPRSRRVGTCNCSCFGGRRCVWIVRTSHRRVTNSCSSSKSRWMQDSVFRSFPWNSIGLLICRVVPCRRPTSISGHVGRNRSRCTL